MDDSREKLILAGLAIFSIVEGLTHFGAAYPDSPGYVAAARFFQGKARPTGIAELRLLRPVVPFLASIMNQFTDMRTSFALVNLAFWCGIAILMFYFAKMLTRNVNASLLSAALLTSSTQMLLYAGAVLTDAAGYFFILLGIYLVIRWDLPRASLSRACLGGLIVAIGILSRESVACVLIFAFVWTILSKGSIAHTFIFIAVPIAVAGFWSLSVGVSYVTWYMQGGLIHATGQHLNLLGWGKRLLISFQNGFGKNFELLGLSALGALGIGDRNNLRVHVSIWAGALPIILAWPFIDTRFTFILFPSIMPLASVGLVRAYRIVLNSGLLRVVWPSFRDSGRFQIALLLLVIAVYVLVTNIVLWNYGSFPWNPYTTPTVSPSGIQ